MKSYGNNSRKDQLAQHDEDADIEKLFMRLEDDIRKLKIEFDVYFNNGVKRPPLEARARLEAFIKRLSDNRNFTFVQRYQFNSLVARYTSYRELWRRMLKMKGDELM